MFNVTKVISNPVVKEGSHSRPNGKVRLIFVILSYFFIVAGTSFNTYADELDEVSVNEVAEDAETFDYIRIFRMVRHLMARKQVKKALREIFPELLEVEGSHISEKGVSELTRLKDISEGQVFLALRENPEIWKDVELYLRRVPVIYSEQDEVSQRKRDEQGRARERFLAKMMEWRDQPGVMEELMEFNDVTKPVPLVKSRGKVTYAVKGLYFNHPRFEQRDGKRIEVRADNLEAQWIKFVEGTTDEYMSNAFDFDLESIADAIIKKHTELGGREASKRAVKRYYADRDVEMDSEARADYIEVMESKNIVVGVDNDVALARPEVGEIVKKLVAAGVATVEVDSVSLNHQKIAVRDWSIPGKGMVLISSGNPTASGLVGDVRGAKNARPNANHLLVIKSDLLAQLVHHELSKTLVMRFRGTSRYRSYTYPLASAWHLMGRGGDYMIMTFSPNGALGNLGKYFLARMVQLASGPIRLLQFAFSDSEVTDALVAKAAEDPLSFDFKSIGEKPFAVSYWSQFLKLIGWKRPTPIEVKNGAVKEYSTDSESLMKEALGAKLFKKFKRSVRIAPRSYGTYSINFRGKAHRVTAKLHHKLMIIGDFLTPGTSFNFSKGAHSNNEQLIVMKSPKLAKMARGAFDWLYSKTTEVDQLEVVVKKRNSMWRFLRKKEATKKSKDKNYSGSSKNKCIESVAS